MPTKIERPAIDAYYANHKEGAQLWIDAISAGNSIDVKLFTANGFVNEVSLREKLISSALNDLQKNNYKDEENLWKHLVVCIDKCSPTFKETLLNDRNVKQHYDKFIGTARVGINGKVIIPFKIDISGPSHLLFKPFDLYDQLDEFTQLLKELDEKFQEIKNDP